jgi:hypothetical protein
MLRRKARPARGDQRDGSGGEAASNDSAAIPTPHPTTRGKNRGFFIFWRDSYGCVLRVPK